jgi:alkaline phosphatase D
MRSYRGADASPDERIYRPDDYLLGPVQTAWLKRELARSRATWKVIAADSPIGYVVGGGSDGTGGVPCGRGLEIAALLSFIKQAGIRNTLWITADLHYTAVHYYDPNQAAFQDFAPFWEFVSGPLHAGTWRPVALDRTFGPQVVFHKAPTDEQGDNLAPCYGLQFFGHVTIDGASETLTVTLKDVADQALWSTTIEPKRPEDARIGMVRR